MPEGKGAEWHGDFGDTSGGKRCRREKVRNSMRDSATLWEENVALDVLSERFGNIIGRKRCRMEKCGMA